MSGNNSTLEQRTFQVPIDCGHLVGNTLRQFAIRGAASWQPIAYRIAPKEGSFGFSGEYPFSLLAFYKGRMLYFNDNPVVTEKVCKFEKQGEDYVCGDMVIKNLGKLGAPSMEVCLLYSRGSRSTEQNYTVTSRLIHQDLKSYVVTPSKHAPTVTFRYTVSPYDFVSETLAIEATPGSIDIAYEQAMSALKGLNIDSQ